ncbi:MAG: hypothetical protein SGPRY_012486, partial [Prymnesium sp.]
MTDTLQRKNSRRSLRQQVSGRSPDELPPDRATSLLLSGGAAGAVSKLVTAPLDRVKIMYQVSPSRVVTLSSVVKTTSDIIKLQGVLALWRGYGASVMRDVPYGAVLFSTFSLYEEAICGTLGRSEDVFTRAAAGCLCGATATCLTYPLDVLRARFAADTSVWRRDANPSKPKYSSYQQGVREIFAKEERAARPATKGFAAFFAGLRPTLMGVVPYSALSFAAFETLKSRVNANAPAYELREIPVAQRLLSGAVSGMFAQTSTYPLH